MLVFGHAGLTLGIAAALDCALSKNGYLPAKVKRSGESPKLSPEAPSTANNLSKDWASRLTSMAGYMDIRVLLVGSLLPDIIDKPVGVFLFRGIFDNGRIFGHTLLFTILAALAGIYLYRRREKTWLLVLSFGTFMHLVLDQMWLQPRTLLWPAYGLSFSKEQLDNWLGNILLALATEPMTFIPEIIGAIILLFFVLVLVQRKKIYAFIKYGQVQ